MTLVVKILPVNAGDARDTNLLPGSGSPGVGNGNLLQYSSLENSMKKRSLAGYCSWDCKELDMIE